jgi:asparagine synthase (glutamine-hydrolysing)
MAVKYDVAKKLVQVSSVSPEHRSLARLASQTRTGLRALRFLGPSWAVYRAWYAAQLRCGMLERKLPCQKWADQPLGKFLSDSRNANPQIYADLRRNHSPQFFFNAGDLPAYRPRLAAWDAEIDFPWAEARQLKQGIHRIFGHDVCLDDPADWHRHPLTGTRFPADRHWSRIDDFALGDIKYMWEPARFGSAFLLVRAYWRTGDETWPELFWRLVESWREANPPQCGAHWKCGQEVALRVMAWCFGLYGMIESAASTPDRVARLAQMIAISGERIAGNIGYGVSQKNNHGISEATGLWTIGRLFPEFRESRWWEKLSASLLERQARELIYDDGAFSQHSFNYQRVALHDLAWAMRLGDTTGRPLSEEFRERVGRCAELLFQVQDETTGKAPCYGQNDGALVLPLTNCDHDDYRPVLQTCSYLSCRRRRYSSGPWDEDLLWLCGPGALSASVTRSEPTSLRADAGGYYTLRGRHAFALVRAATFRHRPSQADQLHVDLWWRGHNIACDPGTFSYNSRPPWDNALSKTAYHNTVTVDGRDQMDRAGRFLWLPWAQARPLHWRSAGALGYWEGEHEGYLRLSDPVRHRRGIVRCGDDHWFVIDDLEGRDLHEHQLHWLLDDFPHRVTDPEGSVTMETGAGQFHLSVGTEEATSQFSLVRADADSPRGWRAPTYGHLRPALSLAWRARAARLRFWTLFSPEPARWTFDSREVRADFSTSTVRFVRRSRELGSPLLQRIVVEGAALSELVIS